MKKGSVFWSWTCICCYGDNIFGFEQPCKRVKQIYILSEASCLLKFSFHLQLTRADLQCQSRTYCTVQCLWCYLWLELSLWNIVYAPGAKITDNLFSCYTHRFVVGIIQVYCFQLILYIPADLLGLFFNSFFISLFLLSLFIFLLTCTDGAGINDSNFNPSYFNIKIIIFLLYCAFLSYTLLGSYNSSLFPGRHLRKSCYL